MDNVRLIDATALSEIIETDKKDDGSLLSMCASYALAKIRHAHTIEIDKRKAKWEIHFGEFRCTRCDEDSDTITKYCPHCGALMRNWQ